VLAQFLHAPQQLPVPQDAEKPAQAQAQPPVLGLNLPTLVQQSQSEFVSTSLDDALPAPWDTQEFEPSSFLVRRLWSAWFQQTFL